MSIPGFWTYETTGVLRPAVEAYLLTDAELSRDHVSVLRAYFQQWLAGFVGVDQLRERINSLVDRRTISAWLADALSLGIDPL